MNKMHKYWTCTYAMMITMSGVVVASSASGSQVQQTTASTTTTSTTAKSTTSTSPSTTTTSSSTTYSTTTTVEIDSITRSDHVTGIIVSELYRRLPPNCKVEACTSTCLTLKLARSTIDCAATCSQNKACIYYRAVEYIGTDDPRDRLCYLHGVPPVITEYSYKFLGQLQH